MLSWVDATSYTERARPGYDALALSWRLYINLCGMGSNPQHSAPVFVLANYRNKNYNMHTLQRVGCTINSFPFYNLWMHATCTRGHGSKSSSIVPTPNIHCSLPFIRIGGSRDL